MYHMLDYECNHGFAFITSSTLSCADICFFMAMIVSFRLCTFRIKDHLDTTVNWFMLD